MNFESIADLVGQVWPHLLAGLSVTLALLAGAHVVMYKRDSRSAIGWIGVIWLAPIVGVLLYVWLGINRLQRRAIRKRRDVSKKIHPAHKSGNPTDELVTNCVPHARHLISLATLTGEVTDRDLLPGNRIQPLVNGDEAYPAMLAAIDAAKSSVVLATYIFDYDRAGKQFIEALTRAKARGVEVRVLIDDIGARYSWPSSVGKLRAAGLKVARFLPSLLPGWFAYSNLRNHRKLLVVDGRMGFTGGCNIREGNLLGLNPRHPIHDMHFAVDGPVVAHMHEVFAEDWAFADGEILQGGIWQPELPPLGATAARGISAGPDNDHDKLRLTLLGAIACAQSSIAIVTPYFLPEIPLITALNIAALRGVQVDIILPENNNLALVKWASMAHLWQMLEHGCRIWFTTGPFDHTKLMLVDTAWTLLGSANWDPRSLRLNFEFNIECYDVDLAKQLQKIIADKRACARQVTLEEVDSRGIPIRLRDGVARLLTPYL